jgi:Holliday junction resolvase-like predicted endonuclease
MHKDVDAHFRARMDASAKAEATIAAWLKRAGWWVLLSPEHDGDQSYSDIYVRDGKGRTLAQVEVKSRKLSFYSPETFPYEDAALATKAKHRDIRDYVVFSQETGIAVVSPVGAKRFIRVQSDNARGVAGPVYCAKREHMVTFSDWMAELELRSAEP